MEYQEKRDDKATGYDSGEAVRQVSHDEEVGETNKKPWWNSVKKRGSALQIIIAALLALAIGLPVALTVEKVPKEVSPLLGIPGNLWLRALKTVGMSR